MARSTSLNTIHRIRAAGQSVWYDNISRELVESGALARLVDQGVTGLTSNPTIFEKAMASGTAYDAAILALAERSLDPDALFEALAIDDIRAAADALRPVFDATKGADGYCSLELPPAVAHDTQRSIAEGKRLFEALERPNVMIKVPATPEGIPAVRELIAAGVNVNITLIFSLKAYERVIESYLSGLEDLARRNGDLSKAASVASFFVSRVDTAVDATLRARIARGEDHLRPLVGKAAIANAAAAYDLFKQRFGTPRFQALETRGARVQRPLWASTSTKDSAYPDTYYVGSLIGPDTVNTMPQNTLDAVLEHGAAEATLHGAIAGAHRTLQSLAAAGIDMEEVTAALLRDGVTAFAVSYDTLIAGLQRKAGTLLGAPRPPFARLGDARHAVAAAADRLDDDRLIERMWRRDHTVWRPDPREIANRLGWLDVMNEMERHIPELEAFAKEVRDAGFRRIVLLAMGGSAFSPELYARTFGRPDYPTLMMIDSTVPGWVRRVTDENDPRHTLYIVSSKSGTTLEVMSFYRHFSDAAERAVGPDQAGKHFVAITDPGTPLARMGKDTGFRKVFLNPPDVGGRFSGLSLFGLVPAALTGADLHAFVDATKRMQQACRAIPTAHYNPGAWLGAAAAALTQAGVDKLILVTSPSLASFGLWVEQMLAESLGKDGTGVIPIAGEPAMPAHTYGDDHFFVYLRLDGDDNGATDAHFEALRKAGRPVLRFDLPDRYDMAAELYRWGFGTAVAGALLGVHPFDQPDVQRAKDFTEEGLRTFIDEHRMPEPPPTLDVDALLEQLGPGNYLALLCYAPRSPAIEAAAIRVRQAAIRRFGIATSFGYGPRYLHSTGQMHKAGAPKGLFVQAVDTGGPDVPIPGQPYGFRVLAESQAIGDLKALLQRHRAVARLAAPRGIAAALDDLAKRIEARRPAVD
ncbi:MAG: bifunctional transaldolase/phosoglucose isomerase [SAR202 cluster bacterium]|nr:bifunctional transaldolase/phosoglucose isomerase [SAR202 cluster bacterium]